MCDLAKGLGCRDFCIASFCVFLGLRPAEVCRIRRRGLEGNRLTVPARASKVRKARALFPPEHPTRPSEFAPEIARPLADYLTWRALRGPFGADDPLFIGRPGEPLRTRSLRSVCNSLAEAAKVDKSRVTIYRMRHSCAVRALKKSDWNTECVRRILGHTSTGMMQRYLRLADEDLAGQAGRVDVMDGIISETAQRKRGREAAKAEVPEQPATEQPTRPKRERPRKERKPRVPQDLLTIAFRGPLANRFQELAERHRMSLARVLQDGLLLWESSVAAGYQPGTALSEWQGRQAQEGAGA